MTAEQFAARLGSYASPNDPVRLPDVRPQPLLQQSTVALLDSDAAEDLKDVADSRLVFYYGTYVRRGYLEQRAASLTRVPEARGVATGSGITIAVIDTGIDAFHPALAGALLPGYNFLADSSDVSENALLPPSASDWEDREEEEDSDEDLVAVQVNQSTVALLDQSTVALLDQSTVALLDQSTVALLDGGQLPPAYGHATAVAGILRLVAPGSRIMPLQVFDSSGQGDVYNIVRAIRYAVRHGARVINMSFGLPKDNKALSEAIQYAKSRGVYCAGAVGNDSADIEQYPAKYSSVSGVTATDMKDLAASFSNYGKSADVAAPGVGIITAFPGGTYALVSGTSFSTPFLAGGGALAFSVKPGLDQGTVEDILETTGVPIENLNPDRYLGKTRIDFVNALREAGSK